MAVDCIIFGFSEGEFNLLLLKRNFEPAKGKWSLMGGFVQKTKVSTMRPSGYWLRTDGTGKCVYGTSRCTFGAIDRDPGERVVSVAYYAFSQYK
jgi:ADP-ribose pyrophosphatase YjhB (NUDIX family)